jgi:[ribosomal protein S5]-alanine N-acetyltransferase
VTDSAPNVRLRAVEQTDVEQWRAWINDPEVMDGLDRVLPATEDEHRNFIERNISGNPSAVWFSIEFDGKYVGNIWLWDMHSRHRRGEVRLFIGDAETRGRGAGVAAIRAIAAYAFDKLGLHKLVAYVHESNEPSRKAFEAAGFFEEAVLRDEAFRDGGFRAVRRMARFGKPDERG